MNIRKRIALTFGGAVLAACVGVGGVAAANAATPTGGQAPVSASATTQASPSDGASGSAPASAATSAATAAPLPPFPGTSPDFTAWVATLTPAQQQAVLTQQEAGLARYAGVTPVVQKLSSNIKILEHALGQ